MQGDHPYEIYLIASGRVNFLMEIGDCVFKSWPKGSYFGDIEILFNKCRICTAKADSNCDIFTLNKKIFQTVIYKYYPDIEKELRELALEREYRILHALKKAHKVLEKIGIIDAL
jgi:CRP-like cAMP-binding protein